MSDSEARKRAAAARREKILAKGTDRLQKITTSGRGDEATLWDTKTPAQRHGAQPARPTPNGALDPADVDLSTLPPSGLPDNALQSMMQGNSFADRFAGTDSPRSATPNTMNDVLAQMMAGGGGPGATGQPPHPLLAQLLGGGDADQQQQIHPVRPRTWQDRLLPALHLVTMLCLAFYAVYVIEPTRRMEGLGLQRAIAGAAGDGRGVSWSAWASLAGDRSGGKRTTERIWRSVLAGGLAQVPLFYLFLTAELLLQSTELLLARDQLPPPSLLTMALPYLPPRLGMYATTGLRYWSLIGTLLDDFAVLIVAIGLLVLLAEWRSGA